MDLPVFNVSAYIHVYIYTCIYIYIYGLTSNTGKSISIYPDPQMHACMHTYIHIGNFWSRSKNCIYGHTIRLSSLVCVCVVGYVTKWGIYPSGLYLNYSISCPRRPDLIAVARGVWSSHTSLGTSGERSISNNLSENIAISATYITSWLLKGLGLSVWVPRAQQWSEVRSGIDFCVT